MSVFKDGSGVFGGGVLKMRVFKDRTPYYIIISFNTPDAVWYAPAPAP